MVLLVLLGLLNILLSSIIRDHKEMEDEVATNNIVFMAQHAMWSEYLKYANWWNIPKLPFKLLFSKFHTEFDKDEKLLYCKSSFCANAVRSEVRNWKSWVSHLTGLFKVFSHKKVLCACISISNRAKKTGQRMQRKEQTP